MTKSFFLKSPELSGTFANTAGACRVTFEGRAESADTREHLRSFLAKVDDAMVEAAARSVSVDFGAVVFVNSSCFKEFVVWLTTMSAREQAKQYRIAFKSNPAVRWQRASLHTLATFASDLVEIVS